MCTKPQQFLPEKPKLLVLYERQSRPRDRDRDRQSSQENLESSRAGIEREKDENPDEPRASAVATKPGMRSSSSSSREAIATSNFHAPRYYNNGEHPTHNKLNRSPPSPPLLLLVPRLLLFLIVPTLARGWTTVFSTSSHPGVAVGLWTLNGGRRRRRRWRTKKARRDRRRRRCDCE